MYKAKKEKPSNLSRILECLYRTAPTARIDIAEETGIAPATVSQIVSSMISDGIITELGEAIPDDSTSGRKRVLIDLVPNSLFVMGVEFTEKGLILCITDEKGSLVAQEIRPYCPELADHITDEIISALTSLMTTSQIPSDRLLGIGIAVPGHMDTEARYLVSNRKTWKNFDAHQIAQAFSIPVVCENNARCMALAEYLFHPNESPDSFAFFHVGMGMFCANVVDGELFLGTNFAAGEIGHTIVKANGRLCECGKHGCLQTYASEKRLLKNARLAYENIPNSLLHDLVSSSSQISIDTVLAAYTMGDPVISRYISEAMHFLGVAISNVAIITNPQKIFLHGQLFSNSSIQAELIDYVQQQLTFVERCRMDALQVLPCNLVDGAVGAAALALQNFFL